MKFKSALVAPVIAFLAFTAPISAADSQTPPPGGNSQNGIRNPEGPKEHERGDFEHRVGESHDGFEIIQFVLIGGALVVAVLLAYNAGKRNRKKNNKE